MFKYYRHQALNLLGCLESNQQKSNQLKNKNCMNSTRDKAFSKFLLTNEKHIKERKNWIKKESNNMDKFLEKKN